MRQQKRPREDLKPVKGHHCGCCSVFSWEKKKLDRFHEQYFSDSLTGSKKSQHYLNPTVSHGGVRCLTCGCFTCHHCVVGLHKAILKDHPNIQDPWVLATRQTSPDEILCIAVGHCCMLKSEIPEKPSVAMLSSCAEAVLAGANHYYQYDLSIGSTPLNCVDVFSLGAAGSNVPVTHAVFPIHVAVEIANGNHSIKMLDLVGPVLSVPSPLLPSLPKGFNKTLYRIKVVTVKSTTMETPLFGKQIIYSSQMVVDQNVISPVFFVY